MEQTLQDHEVADTRPDARPGRRIVTSVLVILNVIAYVALVVAAGQLPDSYGSALIYFGSNFGPRTLDGEWWRLLTSIFLHSSLVHLGMNMLALWFLGGFLERQFGSRAFLLLYLVSGVSGSVASVIWDPQVNTVGASGAIYGVIGGLLVCAVHPRTRRAAMTSRVELAIAAAFVGYILVFGMRMPHVDIAAHVGGLAGGIVIGSLLAWPHPSGVEHGSMRHLGYALGAAVLLSALAVFPLHWRSVQIQPELRVRETIKWLGVQDASATQRAIFLRNQVDSGMLPEREWILQSRQDVLPIWREAVSRLEGLQIPEDSRLVPLRTALLAYTKARLLAAATQAQSIESNDPRLAALAATLVRDLPAKEREARRQMAIAFPGGAV